MLFSSSVFLFLFLPVVLLVCITCPCGGGGRGRTCFCCWPPWAVYCLGGEPWFVLVMLGSGWPRRTPGFGLWVDACKRAGSGPPRPLFVTALAVNLEYPVFVYLNT